MLTRANKRKLPGYQEELQKKAKGKNERLLPKPVIKYPGKYIYITEFSECAAISDELLSLVEGVENQSILGFDLEWPFSFKTGPGKTALMQICSSSNDMLTYLFHLYDFKKLPAVLVSLLTHKRIRLAGVNIRNDIHKLCRDFNLHTDIKEQMLENCRDSRNQAKNITTLTGWSMVKLVEHFFNETIDKDKKVRMSQWHIKPLSESQKVYAATDAYVSLRLYRHLQKLAVEEVQPDETHKILIELN